MDQADGDLRSFCGDLLPWSATEECLGSLQQTALSWDVLQVDLDAFESELQDSAAETVSCRSRSRPEHGSGRGCPGENKAHHPVSVQPPRSVFLQQLQPPSLDSSSSPQGPYAGQLSQDIASLLDSRSTSVPAVLPLASLHHQQPRFQAAQAQAQQQQHSLHSRSSQPSAYMTVPVVLDPEQLQPHAAGFAWQHAAVPDSSPSYLMSSHLRAASRNQSSAPSAAWRNLRARLWGDEDRTPEALFARDDGAIAEHTSLSPQHASALQANGRQAMPGAPALPVMSMPEHDSICSVSYAHPTVSTCMLGLKPATSCEVDALMSLSNRPHDAFPHAPAVQRALDAELHASAAEVSHPMELFMQQQQQQQQQALHEAKMRRRRVTTSGAAPCLDGLPYTGQVSMPQIDKLPIGHSLPQLGSPYTNMSDPPDRGLPSSPSFPSLHPRVHRDHQLQVWESQQRASPSTSGQHTTAHTPDFLTTHPGPAPSLFPTNEQLQRLNQQPSRALHRSKWPGDVRQVPCSSFAEDDRDHKQHPMPPLNQKIRQVPSIAGLYDRTPLNAATLVEAGNELRMSDPSLAAMPVEVPPGSASTHAQAMGYMHGGKHSQPGYGSSGASSPGLASKHAFDEEASDSELQLEQQLMAWSAEGSVASQDHGILSGMAAGIEVDMPPAAGMEVDMLPAVVARLTHQLGLSGSMIPALAAGIAANAAAGTAADPASCLTAEAGLITKQVKQTAFEIPADASIADNDIRQFGGPLVVTQPSFSSITAMHPTPNTAAGAAAAARLGIARHSTDLQQTSVMPDTKLNLGGAQPETQVRIPKPSGASLAQKRRISDAQQGGESHRGEKLRKKLSRDTAGGAKLMNMPLDGPTKASQQLKALDQINLLGLKNADPKVGINSPDIWV